MLHVVLSSFTLVAVSEMGDKTQLLAFSLATRFKRPWVIMGGILTATILNHALASSVGSWVSAHIPVPVMAAVLAILFIGFGFWTLKPDQLDEVGSVGRYGPYLTTVLLFFLAEMGDKTQFATLALAAEFHSIFWVTLGTTLGMMVSDGLAVFLGEKLAAHVQARQVRWFAASLFFIFGLVSAAESIRYYFQ